MGALLGRTKHLRIPRPGGDLIGARPIDAHLDADTLLDSETILPDCTYWEEGNDINRYIDPKHPQFWQPKHHPAA